MRTFLTFLFVSILLGMIAVTTYASLDRSILDVPREVTSAPWFHATLADAYFGFLTFYVWVYYKEATTMRRLLWFVLIMTLGNIAMAIYMLIQLRSWEPEEGIASLLLRRSSPTA